MARTLKRGGWHIVSCDLARRGVRHGAHRTAVRLMLLVYVQDVDSQSITLLKRPATLSADRLQITDQFNSLIIHYRTHASQATVELLRFLYICCPTLRFFLFPPLSLPFPFRSPCCFFHLPPIPLHFFAPSCSISFSYIPSHSIPFPFHSNQLSFVFSSFLLPFR